MCSLWYNQSKNINAVLRVEQERCVTYNEPEKRTTLRIIAFIWY